LRAVAEGGNQVAVGGTEPFLPLFYCQLGKPAGFFRGALAVGNERADDEVRRDDALPRTVAGRPTHAVCMLPCGMLCSDVVTAFNQ
jgi:hypothetical protein